VVLSSFFSSVAKAVDCVFVLRAFSVVMGDEHVYYDRWCSCAHYLHFLKDHPILKVFSFYDAVSTLSALSALSFYGVFSPRRVFLAHRQPQTNRHHYSLPSFVCDSFSDFSEVDEACELCYVAIEMNNNSIHVR